ncbi:MAG: arginine decarboxylase, pyruvoyl-dependent [Candidatus Diapherotrites archaeon]|nr:arginine decarboxylase, pyruvoyl-dependent [Candidatus Diapherotrites archaeon]
MVPKKVFFTNGVGVHKEKLASFEMALRDAGIAQFNLVNVSSIMPPACKIVTKKKGLQELQAGEIVHCVMSRNDTCEPNRLLAAAVGAAVPADKSQHGYISEHHCYGQTERATGDYAEDLAAGMLASTLGIQDPDAVEWKERQQYYKISGKIVRTFNATQSSVGAKNGNWVTVLAAAVFIP